MNTHRPRSMVKRRNVAPRAFLLLLVGILVVGFTVSTAAAAATQEAAGGNSQRPPGVPAGVPGPFGKDIAKEFNDDDLKVKEEKPRGRWEFGLTFDMGQLNDSSVPVAVGGIQSLSGGGKFAGVFKIKRLEIKNRSPKALNSVQLRWVITYLDDPTKVLLEGTTPFINFWAEANSSQVVEIPTIYPVLLFKPLVKDGELNGRFMLRIGVQEARFDDGSFWRHQEPVAFFKVTIELR